MATATEGAIVVDAAAGDCGYGGVRGRGRRRHLPREHGQVVLHRLKLRDRPAELVTICGVPERLLQAALERSGHLLGAHRRSHSPQSLGKVHRRRRRPCDRDDSVEEDGIARLAGERRPRFDSARGTVDDGDALGRFLRTVAFEHHYEMSAGASERYSRRGARQCTAFEPDQGRTIAAHDGERAFGDFETGFRPEPAGQKRLRERCGHGVHPCQTDDRESVLDTCAGPAERFGDPRPGECGFLQRIPQRVGPSAVFGGGDHFRAAEFAEQTVSRIDDQEISVHAKEKGGSAWSGDTARVRST